jgi:LysM repeat protein
MDTRARRSPLRILAPVAIVVFGIALVLIVASGGTSGGGGGGQSASAAQKARDLGTSRSARRKARRTRTTTTTTTTPTSTTATTSEGFYIVKQGDTLGKIAQDTGVSVQTLQDLNPGLDQFSLVAGQKIKLR